MSFLFLLLFMLATTSGSLHPAFSAYSLGIGEYVHAGPVQDTDTPWPRFR